MSFKEETNFALDEYNQHSWLRKKGDLLINVCGRSCKKMFYGSLMISRISFKKQVNEKLNTKLQKPGRTFMYCSMCAWWDNVFVVLTDDYGVEKIR